MSLVASRHVVDLNISFHSTSAGLEFVFANYALTISAFSCVIGRGNYAVKYFEMKSLIEPDFILSAIELYMLILIL